MLLVVTTIFVTKISAQNAEFYLSTSSFITNSAWFSGGALVGPGIEGKICDGLAAFAEIEVGAQLNDDKFKRAKKTAFASTAVAGLVIGGWANENSTARIEIFFGGHYSEHELLPFIGGGLNFKTSEKTQMSFRAGVIKGTVVHDVGGLGEVVFAYKL